MEFFWSTAWDWKEANFMSCFIFAILARSTPSLAYTPCVW
jgi:hypothetical protein